MMRFLLTVLFLALLPSQGWAASCGTFNELADWLAADFEEYPVWISTSQSSDQKPLVMTVFLNEETGTWTLLSTNPYLTCAIASGHHWRPYDGDAAGDRL